MCAHNFRLTVSEGALSYSLTFFLHRSYPLVVSVACRLVRLPVTLLTMPKSRTAPTGPTAPTLPGLNRDELCALSDDALTTYASIECEPGSDSHYDAIMEMCNRGLTSLPQ